MNPQPPHAGGGFDHNRDRERDIEEQRHRAIQQEEMARRERERERDEAERQQHREPYQPSAPHHSSAGSLPIHQPVASRISTTIHSPGGLLANHGVSAPPIPIGAPAHGYPAPQHHEPGRPTQHTGPGPAANPQQHPIFAPLPHGQSGPNNSIGGMGPGPGSMISGSLQQGNGRAVPDGPQQVPPMPPFAAAIVTGQAMATGPGGMPQGQQPILNVGCHKWLVGALYVSRG